MILSRISLRVVLLVCAVAQLALAENRGVINDPDGYVNLRASKSVEAPVIARVKAGEPFTFECEEGAEWCRVKLASGKSGWMHLSRIRLHFTEKDLPEDENDSANLSEIEEFARGRGFEYAAITRRAARGEPEALKQFFALAEDVDGAAAESHAEVPTTVYHLLGDQKFAQFLGTHPIAYRVMVRNSIVAYSPMQPATTYLRRHFPETTRVLFRREMIDWFSPDGRYAIRKLFSDEFDLVEAKVTRAELIDKKNGQVLSDLTRDDIGTGEHREGEVLWSPDSQRFAYASSDLSPAGNLFSTPRPRPQRKQTAIYQLAGESFKRVEVPLGDAPGRGDDKELEGAVLGHEHTLPKHWSSPTVLILERHEYYQKLKPDAIGDVKFESSYSFDRLYRITVNIEPDGRASADWKLREERP